MDNITIFNSDDWNVLEFLLMKSRFDIIRSMYENHAFKDFHKSIPNFSTFISVSDNMNSDTKPPFQHVPGFQEMLLTTVDYHRKNPIPLTVNMKMRRRQPRLKGEKLNILETYYKINKYPNSDDKIMLGKMIGRNTRHIQIWFQNKRAKEKKRIAKEKRGLM